MIFLFFIRFYGAFTNKYHLQGVTIEEEKIIIILL